MFFLDCSFCEEMFAGTRTQATKAGWSFVNSAVRCPACSDRRPALKSATEDFKVAEVVGFDRPEDGSAQRYQERRKVRPWAAHTFWWVVHNAVAHLLIAFVPVKPFFTFHDWTSRRMHGE